MAVAAEALKYANQPEFVCPVETMPLSVPRLIDLAPDSAKNYVYVPYEIREPRLLLPDAFNATRIRTKQGEYAVARRLLEASVKPHGIDYNRVVVFKIEDGQARELPELIIPTPSDLPSKGYISNCEDFRGLVVEEKTPTGEIREVIILGGTVVVETDTYSKSGRPTSHLEEMRTISELPKEELPIFAGFLIAHVAEDGESIVVDEFYVGFNAARQKNITPINYIDGKTTFLTRLEDERYKHTISAFTFDHKTGEIEHLGDIPVPPAWWISEKIGLGGTEIIIDDNGDAYLPIHGQEKKKVSDGNHTYEKITYRMGLLRQKPNGEVEVSPNPTFQRSDFNHLVSPDCELRKEKEVIYFCSHSRRNGGIVYDPALGDRQNFFDVYQPMEDVRNAFLQRQDIYVAL